MKRFIIVGLVIFIVASYLVMYRVRFTETAVKTTFGEAAAQPDETPGLKFLVPYVQNVVKYDKRARYLESKPETVQTSDARQVVATAYLTWQVTDPKVFFQTFSGQGQREINHYRGAERMLSDKLRSAMGEVSRFRFDELLSTSENGSKLAECEQKVLDYLKGLGSNKDSESLTEKYGITPVSVGIIGLELPEETTAKVFDAMQTNRSRIANDAISQGRAMANTIRSTAEQDAKTILEFAKRRADAIRAEGDREGTKFQAELQKQPELAVFLRNMELWKNVMGNNRATVFLSYGPKGLPGFQFLQPGAMSQMKAGALEGFDPSKVPAPKTGQPATPNEAQKNTASKGTNE